VFLSLFLALIRYKMLINVCSFLLNAEVLPFLHPVDGVMIAVVQTGSSDGGSRVEVKLICMTQCRLASVDGAV